MFHQRRQQYGHDLDRRQRILSDHVPLLYKNGLTWVCFVVVFNYYEHFGASNNVTSCSWLRNNDLPLRKRWRSFLFPGALGWGARGYEDTMRVWGDANLSQCVLIVKDSWSHTRPLWFTAIMCYLHMQDQILHYTAVKQWMAQSPHNGFVWTLC